MAATRARALLLVLSCWSCRGESLAWPPEAAAGAAAAGAGGRAAGGPIRTPYYVLSTSAARECEPVPIGLGASDARRFGVELELQPTSDVQVPANPYYARLVDAEGVVYEATLGGCGAPLAPSLPARGKVARGWVVFEVPRRARGFTLTYAPELVGQPKVELSIPLQD